MLKIGIDELATEKQCLIGYTFIIVDDNSYTKLIQDTAKLRSMSSIKLLHGIKIQIELQRNLQAFS